MFLNKTRLKKCIKDAYNGKGLTVGNVFGGFYIAGQAWESWGMHGYVPNWVYGAVIEYAGALPELNEAFTAQKAELRSGLLIFDNMNLQECFALAKTPFLITPVTYGGDRDYRMVQRQQDRKLYALPEDLYSLIDVRERGDEAFPVGPSQTADGGALIWGNGCCYLKLALSGVWNEKTIEVMETLSQIDFAEEK